MGRHAAARISRGGVLSTSAPADADFRLNRRALRRAFDRAGASYDASARLQAIVRAELLERLQDLPLTPQAVLDLGAGTGQGARELKRRYPRALVVALDVAPGMLHEARRWSRPFRRFERLCADARQLPLRTASVDLVFTNLMLQWCDELPAALKEIRRVLSPGGLLLLSSFGPDTLAELRAAWAGADQHEHVHRFPDVHVVGDQLLRSGFSRPVLDVDRHVLEYDTVLDLMRELQGIGARNASERRAPGLTGRGRLRAMQDAYEGLRRQGRLPATFEVIHAVAWAARQADTGAAARAGGDVHIPVGSIRRREER